MTNIDIFFLIIVTIFGLGFSSFATTAIYRLPRGMPWIGDKPKCFLCNADLKFLDYAAIISHFYCRGQCRHCKGKYELSYSYLVAEILITSSFIITYLQYGFTQEFVLISWLSICTVLTALIHIDYKKVPYQLLISSLVLGVMYRVLQDNEIYGLMFSAMLAGIAAISFRYIYYISLGQKKIARDYLEYKPKGRFNGPGFEHVKLLIVSSVWLDLNQFIVLCSTAFILIALWSAINKRTLSIPTILSILLLLTLIFAPQLDSFKLIEYSL